MDTPAKANKPSASSSSSPFSTSTAPSSIQKMDIDASNSAQSSDVEIIEVEVLEERNGSPTALTSSSNTNGKRKIQDLNASDKTTVKKAKTSSTTASTKSKEDTSATAGASTKSSTTTTTTGSDLPVEIKNGKFVFKQKAITWDNASSTMRGRLAFTDYFATLLGSDDGKIEVWPQEHHAVIARLIHESDSKTTSTLASTVKKQLTEMVKASAESGMDEDSQEDKPVAKDPIPLADRIPLDPLKALIDSLAKRINFGLDPSDIPAHADGTPSDLPAGVHFWRWEVQDFSLLPKEFEAKLEKRRVERALMKTTTVSLFSALSPSEQSDLLSKSAGGGSKKAAAKTGGEVKSDEKPVASGSGAAPTVKKETLKKEKEKKVKEVKVEDPEVIKEKEEKERIKKEKAKEREEARLKKAKETAEKEEKKAKKTAAEEKKKADLQKSSGFMTGFFIKKSASPAPAGLSAAAASSTGERKKESDFDRVFKPFHVKADVQLAPINRFKDLAKTRPDVVVDGNESLTAKESIASFLADVPSRHLRPYNPRPEPPLSVREVVHQINEFALTGMDASGMYKSLKDKKKVQVKLLKFHDDVRPGYVGTWTKKSRVVGPRTPFGKDTALLRYDYDSEDEWDEDEAEAEGDCEDVNSSGEGEDSDDEGCLSDDWLCDDDEVEFEPGHDGDGVVPMMVDGDDDLIIMESATEVARKKILDREKKSKMAKEGAARKKKLTGPLVATVKGPYWEDKIGETKYNGFSGMKIQFLNDAFFNLDPNNWHSKPLLTASTSKVLPPTKASSPGIVSNPLLPTTTTTSATASTSVVNKLEKKQAKPIADSLMSKFVGLVHGSETTREKVVDLVYENMKEHKITKVAINATFREAGVAKLKMPNGGPMAWQVNADTLARYPLSITLD